MRTDHRRALVIASIGAALALAAAPAAAQSPSAAPPTELLQMDYTMDWKPDGDWAPYLWAVENGYFAEEGLEVSMTAGDGSSAALPLIATGQMDIGQISGPPLVQSVSEGFPVTSVGVQMAASPLVLLADADKGIETVQDLEGKRVAVQEGEFEGAVWDAFVAATGIDGSTIEEVPAAGGADALFLDKQVDAFMDFYTSGALINLTENREGNETLFLIRDYLDILGHTTVVNNDFLAQNPDAVRAFLRAWARGMLYTIEHQPETVDLILEKYPENDRAATEWSVARYAEFWSEDQAQAGGLLSFTPELWDSTKQVMVDAGLMEDVDISGLFTTDYLPDPPIMPPAAAPAASPGGSPAA
jgi:ABC-type nitrate/sulfonate/bicarbonate transport system substrate-binding protein